MVGPDVGTKVGPGAGVGTERGVGPIAGTGVGSAAVPHAAIPKATNGNTSHKSFKI